MELNVVAQVGKKHEGGGIFCPYRTPNNLTDTLMRSATSYFPLNLPNTFEVGFQRHARHPDVLCSGSESLAELTSCSSRARNVEPPGPPAAPCSSNSSPSGSNTHCPHLAPFEESDFSLTLTLLLLRRGLSPRLGGTMPTSVSGPDIEPIKFLILSGIGTRGW